MPRIHVPQNESAQPPSRLLALIHSCSSAGHGWPPLDYLLCVSQLVTGKILTVPRFFYADSGQWEIVAVEQRHHREGDRSQLASRPLFASKERVNLFTYGH